MAVTETNSPLISAYKEKKRVRTVNYRGSLLNIDTRIYGTTFTNDSVGSKVYISLIPFSASIKSVEYLFTANLSGDNLAFTLGIAGINQDGSFQEIKANIAGAGIRPAVAASTWKQVNCLAFMNKTIYELLCKDEGGYQVPIEEFEPYVKTKYGVLFFKVTVIGSQENSDLAVRITYVEGSPSEMPLTVQAIR